MRSLPQLCLFHCILSLLTDIDIKIPWFAKLFDALTQTDPSTGNSVANYANICTALDLLTFLLQVLPQNVILAGFKTLHKGLNVCMTCGNTKVVRYVHALLTRLLGMFPPEHGKYARVLKRGIIIALSTYCFFQ